MNKHLIIPNCIIFAMMLFACSPEALNSDPVVTDSAEAIGINSAVLSGFSNTSLTTGVKFGIMLSVEEEPSSSNSTLLEGKDLDERNHFKVTANNLYADAKYYYRAYQFYDGVYKTGEVKSFTTKQGELSFTLWDPARVLEVQAMIRGRYFVTGTAVRDIKTGFFYSEGVKSASELLREGTYTPSEGIDSENVFWRRLHNIKPLTKYSYIACASLGDEKVKGDVVTFETGTLNVSYSLATPVQVTRTTATIFFDVSLEGKSLQYGSAKPNSYDVYLRYGIINGKPDRQVKASASQEYGAWKAELTGLDGGRTYYFNISAEVQYITKEDGVHLYYAPEDLFQSFTTLSYVQ